MAVPMAFHAAKKVRENINKPMVTMTDAAHEETSSTDWNAKFKFFEGQGNVLVRRYNEKMMNAIWGLYNRNSAHNFKSNVDGGEPAAAAVSAPVAASTSAVMSFDSVAYQISRITPGLLSIQP